MAREWGSEPKCKESGELGIFSLFSLTSFTHTTSPLFEVMMNIDHFSKYCKEKFDWEEKERRIREEGGRPEIPPSTIFKSIREMPVLGQTSLLGVDQYARSPEALRWYASQRRMVVSDTTLERRLRRMEGGSVREIGYEAIRGLDQEGHWNWRLPTGRKIRVGIVDGSDFGGFWASVLAVAGASDGVLDLEPYEGRGHELGSSRKLLRRAREKLGKGFFDVVTTDGLYRTEKDFRLCRRELGSDLLVKTDEEGLTVIQDARSLFFPRDGRKIPEGVKRVEGMDPERQVRYEVLWAEGFEWKALEYPLTVAWVREAFLKPAKGRPEVVTFWVLTTMPGLLGEELRALAHRRWHIENGVFKRLNALVRSKRSWSHSPKVREMLLRIWLLGLTLLGAYLVERGLNLIHEHWRSMKVTWRWVNEQMRLSLSPLCLSP